MNQNNEVELRRSLEEVLARRKAEDEWPWVCAEFKRFKRDKLDLDDCIPRKFPVSHKAFLKLVLPKRLYGRTAEQARLYKDWLAHELEKPPQPQLAVYYGSKSPEVCTIYPCCTDGPTS